MSVSETRIRPPQQRRSQESLARIMQSGFEVLCEQGFDGFTLQEVSKRAGVSIGSIYARVKSREDLIMAIYEQQMAWTAEEALIHGAADAADLTPRERIEAIATAEAELMLAHGDVLRVFMRQAPLNPMIWDRGAEKSHTNASVFTDALLEHRADIHHPDPELAADVAWRILYCVIARRITHGATFESPRKVSDQVLVRETARAVADYLI